MRCNQVSIGIERFGEYVPKNYPGNVQRISVYVDDFTSSMRHCPKPMPWQLMSWRNMIILALVLMSVPMNMPE